MSEWERPRHTAGRLGAEDCLASAAEQRIERSVEDIHTEKWAFVDEYGQPSLETHLANVGCYFIVVAILLDSGALGDARSGLERIRIAHFQTGEMKARKLGANRGRWVKVLADLRRVPFRFYALAVDKRRIDASGGLQWKNSFYKHVCGRVYGKLMRAHPALRVRADEYGRGDFKESFARYIDENHRPTLFERGTFEFVDAKSEVLVQTADVLCGLLARSYEPDMLLPDPGELLAMMAGHAVVVDEWPPRYRVTAGASELMDAAGLDDRIATYALSQAERYVYEHEDDSDPIEQCRVAVLDRLILERRIGGVGNYVSTAELLEVLSTRGLGTREATWLRMNLIAPLRDAEVIVTSSTAGYSLPQSEADLVAYVRHAEFVCVPMLKRIDAACRAIKIATDGDADILALEQVEPVRKLVDALK